MKKVFNWVLKLIMVYIIIIQYVSLRLEDIPFSKKI